VRGTLIPSFPTKTFPNHYSIVTGLYPSEHGIVGNTFQDEQLGTFKLSDHAQLVKAEWWGGEPIWVTAQAQHRRTAVDWPGGEAAIRGVRPTYWNVYDKEQSSETRVRRILSWLDLPERQRPTFLSLYFDVVDTAGHDFGPDSDEVKTAVGTVDDAMGVLLDGLEKRGIADKVDIIIIADHGMAPVSKERVVLLDDYVDLETLDVVDWNPTLSFRIKDPNTEEVLSKLARVPHLKVYPRNETPGRWHYRDNPRITPFVGIVDEGWSVSYHKWVEGHPKYPGGGQHGFDNNLMSMRAVFIAHGPGFRSGVQLAPIENIDVYDLMAKLLKIQPAKNEGKLEVFAPALKSAAGAAAAKGAK
jgi:predicted AlkP superfamily pyrophosphatase or phosphodiesterase